MIAAIASCIFVIYLYRTLNKDGEAKSSSAQGTPGPQDLAGRLRALDARLRALVANGKGESSS